MNITAPVRTNFCTEALDLLATVRGQRYEANREWFERSQRLLAEYRATVKKPVNKSKKSVNKLH